jgi:broad specificity phosphatase PhoE
MPADRIHFIRHGEVHNPDGILYGRLPNFALSERGVAMAKLAAQDLKDQGRQVRAVFASPLQRTRESAKPFKEIFGLDAMVDERLIEPHNIFEGKVLSASKILLQPGVWFHLRNPSKPSWGEPFVSIANRMEAAALEAFDSVASGDVVLVSHQAPIAVLHLLATGQKLVLKPRGRRCDLSSITSFERVNGKLVEVDYRDPAKQLRDGAIDVGAV